MLHSDFSPTIPQGASSTSYESLNNDLKSHTFSGTIRCSDPLESISSLLHVGSIKIPQDDRCGPLKATQSSAIKPMSQGGEQSRTLRVMMEH